jgi:type IV secretory pathway VirD2 relaxase
VAKKTDEADEFRIRPNRPHSGGKNEARAWSTALRTVLRYAGTSRRSAPPATSGRPRAPRKQFNQRCAVRTMYTANKTAGQWRAHGRYIARESAGGAVLGQVLSPGTDERLRPLEPAKELERWQSEGDPRLWKLIVSPEFGERIDLDRLTRDLMVCMEKDLGTKLEWVAVTHFNTEHPHVHIALRGIREDKSALDLPRDYVRHGIRAIAEDLATRQLGHRNHLDALASERREIQERRFTSLDRAINRANSVEAAGSSGTAEHFVVQRAGEKAGRPRELHIDARLLALQQMGLAEPAGANEWRVRRDFETVLRAMQRTNDRQKMLASHGAILSDERLPLVVLDMRKLKTLEGRVLAHGEEEGGKSAGRHYLLLEGTDAKVHLIYYTPEMEDARSRGQLRANSFVQLRKRFENGRPLLEVGDLGDAERALHNKGHFSERARELLRIGIVPSEGGWGGWLGRYRAAMRRAVEDLNSSQIYREPERGR